MGRSFISFTGWFDFFNYHCMGECNGFSILSFCKEILMLSTALFVEPDEYNAKLIKHFFAEFLPVLKNKLFIYRKKEIDQYQVIIFIFT